MKEVRLLVEYTVHNGSDVPIWIATWSQKEETGEYPFVVNRAQGRISVLLENWHYCIRGESSPESPIMTNFRELSPGETTEFALMMEFPIGWVDPERLGFAETKSIEATFAYYEHDLTALTRRAVRPESRNLYVDCFEANDMRKLEKKITVELANERSLRVVGRDGHWQVQ